MPSLESLQIRRNHSSPKSLTLRRQTPANAARSGAVSELAVAGAHGYPLQTHTEDGTDLELFSTQNQSSLCRRPRHIGLPRPACGAQRDSTTSAVPTSQQGQSGCRSGSAEAPFPGPFATQLGVTVSRLARSDSRQSGPLGVASRSLANTDRVVIGPSSASGGPSEYPYATNQTPVRRFDALMTPMRACISGPRSSAAINSASIAACHSSDCRVLPGNAMR